MSVKNTDSNDKETAFFRHYTEPCGKWNKPNKIALMILRILFVYADMKNGKS